MTPQNVSEAAPGLPRGADAPLVGALDVFPTEAPCYYADTWGAPRSGGRRHEGVDIIAALGKPLYAVRDGRITKKYFNTERAGNGLQLTASDGSYYFYAHLDRYADGIDLGARVKSGQLIGYVGRTGNALVPHLHFEVHPNGGKAVNPTPYVAAVDKCGYKPKPTTTTTSSTSSTTTTTAKPTTTAKATTTAKSTTTTTLKGTTSSSTTVKGSSTTTTTSKPTTTAKGTTTSSTTSTTTSTTEPPVTDDPGDGSDPIDAGAPELSLAAGTFKAGVKNKIQISSRGPLPGGLVRADVKITATGAKSRGSLIVGDCDHKGRTVLALVPGKKTLKTLVSALSTDGRICVTATVSSKLEVTVRRAWTADETRLTLIDPTVVFDSESTDRIPSRNRVYKVRLAGVAGVPASADYLLLWITGTADTDAVLQAGKCGRKRTELVKLAAGEELKTSEFFRLLGDTVCISATSPASVHIEVVGYG